MYDFLKFVDAVISETIKAATLGLGMKILDNPAQRKFVSSVCHAHSNAHKPHTPVAHAIFMLEKNIYLKYISLVNTYRLIKNTFAKPTLTHITLKSVCRPHNHILRSRVGGAFQSRFTACISASPFGPFS